VTDAEIARYGAGFYEPETQPEPRQEPDSVEAEEPDRTEPDAAVLAPQAAKMDEIHRQVRDIGARLDELAMARARHAREKAAEVTSMAVPAEDPDVAPSAAWIDGVRGRLREAIRHEPMPRVPAAAAIESAAEASVSGPEAAD